VTWSEFVQSVNDLDAPADAQLEFSNDGWYHMKLVAIAHQGGTVEIMLAPS
jgi:hypothetical protein